MVESPPFVAAAFVLCKLLTPALSLSLHDPLSLESLLLDVRLLLPSVSVAASSGTDAAELLCGPSAADIDGTSSLLLRVALLPLVVPAAARQTLPLLAPADLAEILPLVLPAAAAEEMRATDAAARW